MEIDLEFSPTHLGDGPLSPFQRHVLAALHRLEAIMTKTADSLAALEAVTAKVATSVEALLATPPATTGVDDDTTSASIDGVTATLQGVVDKLTPPPAVPVTITVEPTSITGAAGSPVTGSFTATGGAEPYYYAASTILAGVTVNADGSYATDGSSISGSFDLVATDDNGVTSAATGISVSIA